MLVLITGAAGQVGRELSEAFTATGHTVAACDHSMLDVGDRDSTLQVIGHVQPHVVVHAAAWTNVDGCETDPDRAWQVNALGTRHVAEAARLVGARLCYISTDYVFDGTAGRPYTEWDTPNPLSIYGRSKLAGEALMRPDDLVVRTSWVCGRYGKNFVRTILDKTKQGEELAVVDDQHGCPTFADDLAAGICRLVTAGRSGTFHITNQGATTWYQLACDAVGLAGLDPACIRPVRTADVHPPRPARRPAFAVLDNAALRLSGLPALPHHRQSLERLVEAIGHPESDQADRPS